MKLLNTHVVVENTSLIKVKVTVIHVMRDTTAHKVSTHNNINAHQANLVHKVIGGVLRVMQENIVRIMVLRMIK